MPPEATQTENAQVDQKALGAGAAAAAAAQQAEEEQLAQQKKSK
jgi:hypothetical protein